MKFVFVGFCCLLASFLAHGESIDHPGWFEIDSVYSWTDGKVQIWMKDDAEHVCSNASYKRRYYLISSTPGFSEKFSILLSTKAAGKQVKLRYRCNVDGHPEIQAVRMR